MKHGLQAEQLGQRGRGANIISAHISFSPRAAIAPLLDWLPRCVAHDFCVPENSVAFGHDSSFFAVTQQWRTCVRRMLRCRPACIRPPSSLNPRLASGVVAVAEDEGRDRFIRDRRPLYSRENSIGHPHLPYCPRLRRMMLRDSSVTGSHTFTDLRGAQVHARRGGIIRDESWQSMTTNVDVE